MRDTNLALELLLHQFLATLADGPRGYAATMEAWRTHCPRLAVWEEAQERGLIRLEPGAREVQVALTPAGRALL
jgi:D-3-phosphoglycerate dehydrogenase